MLQIEPMEIFKENGLFGLKDKSGDVIIAPQYRDFYPFSCGLACVRTIDYQFAYIDINNIAIVPFGKYIWIDPRFSFGYARVKGYSIIEKKEYWGIINTLGALIVPMVYDNIWTLKEEYIDRIKAFKNNKECNIDLRKAEKYIILDGLKYIKTFTIDEFKMNFNVSKIYVKESQKHKCIIFQYGTNIGVVSNDNYLTDPVISVVCNSAGKVFSLLHNRNNIGVPRVKQQMMKESCKSTNSYTRDYNSYNDYNDYIEELRLDAFEGDESNYWNID